MHNVFKSKITPSLWPLKKGRAPRFPGQKHHRSADRLPTLSPFDEERIVWRKNMEDDVENEDARRRRREREWALRSSDDHDHHHQRHVPPVSTASTPPPPSLIQVHLDYFFLNLMLAFSVSQIQHSVTPIPLWKIDWQLC